MNEQYALSEVTQRLADVAMGRRPADAVILDVKLINVITAEIQEGVDIAVACGRIALVGDAKHAIGEGTRVYHGRGRYAAPGFIDGHLHIESSMMMPGEYARAVVAHGTTSIFPDPHEIGNVFGADGVRMMIDNSRDVPLRCFYLAPSCVPAVAKFEDSGEAIGTDAVRELIGMPEVAGLGEVMNYPAVLSGDTEVHEKIRDTLRAGKIVTSHYPLPAGDGRGMSGYIAAGNRCCHETTCAEDALAKLRLGMYVQVREGSAWRDLREVIRAVTQHKIDTRYVCLVSDDVHPHTLLADGHMDYIIRCAIEEGVDPICAIQMATLNAAQCYRMDQDIGVIAPGRFADIVLLGDLERVVVEDVWINGEPVALDGCAQFVPPKPRLPERMLRGVRLARPLLPEDMRISAPGSAGNEVCVRVIQIVEARAQTHAREAWMAVCDGLVAADVEKNIAKVAVVERHHATGTLGLGFVEGFGLRRGAVASTIGHDAHNLQIVGMNDSDMAFAGNELAAAGGGLIAVLDGAVIARLSLPIGGLMSDEGVHEIARHIEELDAAWKLLGSEIVAPFMSMALLSLSVIPELRITNRGLIDVLAFKETALFV